MFLVSLSLIALGVVYSKQWSGMAMVGFTFLFLLALSILQGNLEIEKGSNVTSSYTYASNGTISSTNQLVLYEYTPWKDSSSHTIGYFLAVVSFIGFASVLINLRGNWRQK